MDRQRQWRCACASISNAIRASTGPSSFVCRNFDAALRKWTEKAQFPAPSNCRRGLLRSSFLHHSYPKCALVAHCGEVDRGSYIDSLVLTDVASGWT